MRTGRGLEAARCALLGGHREQAWEYLTGVPRSEPGLAEVFHQLARAHMAAGENKDAVHVLRELIGRGKVESDNLPLHMTLLEALRASGDSGEGVELGRIAAYDPSVLEGAHGAADAVRGRGRGRRDAARPDPDAGRSQVRALTRRFARPAAPPPVQPPPLRIATPAAPPPAKPTVGFGLPETPESRYEILSELGRGGMGVVHKALDKKLDRHVALKILPWQLRGDETAMRYFKREARAIAALKHPNVVALYDYGEGFGSLYLAMEYLEGPNLQKLIKKDTERVQKNWRTWFVQATRGIAAAHAKGILHRDLKPANLILDEHGTLRILDFGLALPQADAGGTSKLIGSPAFFPPEVLRGEMPSPASDVYSLGAAFYTLATGRWPYVGDDVLVARLERDPDDPRPYAPFLKEEEVAILMKSLARHRPGPLPGRRRAARGAPLARSVGQRPMRIAVVAGDGIGPEMTREALKVLGRARVGSGSGLAESLLFPWGADHFLETGETVPAGAFEMLARDFDAILVGAFGDPRVPDGRHADEILLGMRRRLDLFANVRPVRALHDSARSPQGTRAPPTWTSSSSARTPKGPTRGAAGVEGEGTAGGGGRGGGRDDAPRRRADLPRGLRVRRDVREAPAPRAAPARPHGRQAQRPEARRRPVAPRLSGGRAAFPACEARHMFADALAHEMVRAPGRSTSS